MKIILGSFSIGDEETGEARTNWRSNTDNA